MTAMPSWMSATSIGCMRDRVVGIDDVGVECRSGRAAPRPPARSARCRRWPSTSRALTYWPGHSLCSALGKLRLQLHRAGGGVDLVVEQHQLAAAQQLVAVARDRPAPPAAARLACSAWLMAWKLSSGSVNTTAIGSIWLMTTRPLASAACTMLPGSTRRAPTRPLIGAVMGCSSSCTWRVVDLRLVGLHARPCSCATSARCVSSVCWRGGVLA